MKQTVRWLQLYQLAAGLCDACTGALLIAAPAWTLQRMGISVLPQPLAFARFVGVFVLGVGLSYLWAMRWPMRAWSGQWSTTALIRTGVALLLAVQIASGAMERAWIAVVLTDAALAAMQWLGLSRNWLRLADPN